MRTLLVTLFFASTAAAQPTALQPKRVTLAEKTYDVAEVVSAIKEQTGNPIVDRRSMGAERKVTIGFADLTFWEALDRLAEKIGARVSPFAEDGVALVDGPGRHGKIAYSGIARAEIQTIDVKLDTATDRRTCSIEMEFAWEPRFEPLYLWLDRFAGSYSTDAAGKTLTFDRQARVWQSASRGAARLDITLDGPARSAEKIASIDARVGFVGPTKMLTFRLPAAKGVAMPQEGVNIAIEDVRQSQRHWDIRVAITNPVSKEMPTFESFQSWLGNNRVHLEKKDVVWRPKPDDLEITVQTAREARIRYGFDGAQGRNPTDWQLVVRTPGPIVEFTLPFAFRDVPLP
jgi:hypothetical protein